METINGGGVKRHRPSTKVNGESEARADGGETIAENQPGDDDENDVRLSDCECD